MSLSSVGRTAMALATLKYPEIRYPEDISNVPKVPDKWGFTWPIPTLLISQSFGEATETQAVHFPFF